LAARLQFAHQLIETIKLILETADVAEPDDTTACGTKQTADQHKDANFEDSQNLQKKLALAFAIAGISDAIGAFATPLPPIVWVVDLGTALLLFMVLGRQWLLLPGLALEAIPGLRVLPFWLLVVRARPNFERRCTTHLAVAAIPLALRHASPGDSSMVECGQSIRRTEKATCSRPLPAHSLTGQAPATFSHAGNLSSDRAAARVLCSKHGPNPEDP
jgi:hypothetical protein